MNKMFLAIVASLVLSTSFLIANVAHPVKADPNCDKAGVKLNQREIIAGNTHCAFTDNDGKSPEPERDCNHKNSIKDNDGDGASGCVPRGK